MNSVKGMKNWRQSGVYSDLSEVLMLENLFQALYASDGQSDPFCEWESLQEKKE